MGKSWAAQRIVSCRGSSTPANTPNRDFPSRDFEHCCQCEAKHERFGGVCEGGGELALKQAEKTKIQTLSLPQAYASFGKAVYEQGAQHPDTATLFAAISDLLSAVGSRSVR
jgi:hypothetical protein